MNVNHFDAGGVNVVNKVNPDLNIAGNIDLSTTVLLNKTGNGTLALSGTNANTAGWQITDGTMILQSATALGNTGVGPADHRRRDDRAHRADHPHGRHRRR